MYFRFTCTQKKKESLDELGCGVGPRTLDLIFTEREDKVYYREFKNNVTSPLEQIPQAAAYGSNAVMAQYAAGVKLEDCRCEFLLTNGHLFQFAVVVFMSECMPR